MKCISLEPEHRWWFLKRNIMEAYHRALAQLEWAIWDTEMMEEPR